MSHVRQPEEEKQLQLHNCGSLMPPQCQTEGRKEKNEKQQIPNILR